MSGTPAPADDEVSAAVLATLPGMGPARLASLLETTSPSALRARILRGEGVPGVRAELVARWRPHMARTEPSVRERLTGNGYRVRWWGAADYPARLLDDPEPPAVVFVAGRDPSPGPAVAIVGTRRCTRYGLDVAREFARALAAAGVTVVSGLAKGIDGAAHAGCLDVDGAAAVAVVGSGVDRVYPASNRSLWERVARTGGVLGEAPFGAEPARWRFPARNRLIAALADAVVVVESRARGGSMSTVEAALRRDRPVLAVPGSIRSAASAGTNRLVAEGAIPACDVDDVLVAIGERPVAASCEAPVEVDGVDAEVLDATGWAPVTLQTVALGAGLELGAAAAAVERLVAGGHLVRTGHWIERVAVR